MKAVAIQTAVYDRLNEYASLTAFGPIYDHAPQDAGDNYTVIGDDTRTAWNDHDGTGGDWTLTIHTWSAYRGRKVIKQMQDEIAAALDRYALTVSGATVVNCELEFAESFLDIDGLRRHGVQRFRLIIGE